MQLKQYQQAALDQLRAYLQTLVAEQEKAAKAAAIGITYKWDEQAWEAIMPTPRYQAKRNPLGEPVPNLLIFRPLGLGFQGGAKASCKISQICC